MDCNAAKGSRQNSCVTLEYAVALWTVISMCSIRSSKTVIEKLGEASKAILVCFHMVNEHSQKRLLKEKGERISSLQLHLPQLDYSLLTMVQFDPG